VSSPDFINIGRIDKKLHALFLLQSAFIVRMQRSGSRITVLIYKLVSAFGAAKKKLFASIAEGHSIVAGEIYTTVWVFDHNIIDGTSRAGWHLCP
jgi:hypothetical protein